MFLFFFTLLLLKNTKQRKYTNHKLSKNKNAKQKQIRAEKLNRGRPETVIWAMEDQSITNVTYPHNMANWKPLSVHGWVIVNAYEL